MHIFRTYQQLEHSDCGLACIRMIARYYGKKISPAYLRSLCDSSRLGISVRDITSTLQAIDISAIPLKLKGDHIDDVDLPLPAILFWNHTHFVVPYKIWKGKYYIADPGKGKLRFTREEFDKLWMNPDGYGIIILAEPDEAFHSREFLKDKNSRRLLNMVRDIFLLNRWQFVSIILLMLFTMAGDVLTPLLFQHTVDEGISGKNIPLVWILVLSQLAIFLGNFAGNTLVEYILTRLGLKVNLDMMTSYLSKLVKMPMTFFARKVNSDLIQKADDQERIKNFIVGMPQSVFFTVISLVVFSAMMVYYSPEVFSIFLIATGAGVAWNRLLMRRRREIDFSYFNYMAENRNNVYELVNGMHEIKTGSAERLRITLWGKLQKKIILLSLRKFRLNAITSGGNTLISYMKDIIITGFCATMVIKGEMTIGVMMTVGYISGRLSSPFSRIMGMSGEIQDANMSIERVSEIMETEYAEDGKKKNPILQEISIDHVWFKYPGSTSPFVIKDVSFTIPKGSVTAIVGASGGGKTTLVKLLLGLYPPSKGTISNGDDNLIDIDSFDWLKKCAAVNQDGVIFTGTILSNIALNDEHPDAERARDAVRTACLEGFIDSLPMGINTKIGVSGIEVSGGQKQRLLIARAVYKNPELLILDEATSSLDAANEAEIVRNLNEFTKGKTLVIVAHRLSTVRNADNIIFLEHGRIAETGTHEELIKRKGGYYQLISNQLEIAN